MQTLAINAASVRVAERSPRTFVLTTLASFILGTAGLLVASWYANTRGALVYNSRRAKAEHLATLSRDQLPQVVVLGSSNSMRYSPRTIKTLLGKSAFNYGVFWGRAEDMLCISRYLFESLGHRPELLLIGIDTWSFKPAFDPSLWQPPENPLFPGGRRLLKAHQLIRYHPDVGWLRRSWANFTDALSHKQLVLMWRLLRGPAWVHTLKQPLSEFHMFAADGTRIHYGDPFGGKGNIFEKVESGQYAITEKMESLIQAGDLDHFKGPLALYDDVAFDSRRVGYLDQLLRLCQREGTDVVFVMNPVHPAFLELLDERTDHAQSVTRLRHMLDDFGNQYSRVRGVIDATLLENFGGDPDGFYDPYHPATRNCDRIVEQVAQLLSLP